MALASAASFYAHVYIDKEYHIEGSSLERFAWFRRKRQLHFAHHLHANSNFAVIDFFWAGYSGPIASLIRILTEVPTSRRGATPGGRYQEPDVEAAALPYGLDDPGL